MQEPPLSILLAESSCVVRATIQLQLQQLGHSVAVANHGPEMQTLSDQSPFDACCIDVRMINDLEAEFLDRMFTRSAVIGVRSEIDSLEVGHRFRTKLVKPFSRQELANALAEVPRFANKLPSIQKEELLARVSGNRELLRQMAHLFQTQANLWQEQMCTALKQRNGDELGRIAHQAKGSLANVSAPEAAAAAHELQEFARDGKWDQVAGLVDRLDALLQQIARDLATV